MENLEKEIPKHKKKKKSSTSKAKSKADHKHEYEDVLFIAPKFFGEGVSPHVGSRCKICGKIGSTELCNCIEIDNPNSLETRFHVRYRAMTDEEIYEKYGHLEQVPLESYWQKFAPVERSINE